MPNWRFWERKRGPTAPAEPSSSVTSRGLPPPRHAPLPADPALAAKLAALRRRREGMRYDLERAEAAHRPENPWTERIALLDESLATVAADLRALDAQPPLPSWPLPPVPIEAIAVESADPVTLTFRIGDQAFRFAEETDWDQRGGPVVKGDLRQQDGDATRLVPADVPADRRRALADHLVESVIVFATDLRDRAVDGAPLLPPGKERPTLADLAEPCLECGGWREWGGRCETCAQRAYRRQRLQAEAERLERERAEQEEERAKWAERRSVARRRLADVEAEIAKLGG